MQPQQDPNGFEPLKLKVYPDEEGLEPLELQDLPDVDFEAAMQLPKRRPLPKPSKPAPAPVAPPKPVEQKKERPAHREGIAEDPIEDFTNLAKELAMGIFHTGKIAADYVANPSEWLRDMRRLYGSGKMMSETAGVLWDAVAENYKDDEGNLALLDAMIKRPAHTLADIAGIASLAGGATKLAGKTAGGASRLRIPAEIANALPKMGKADKVVRAGEAMEKAASALDPLSWGGKAVKGVLAKPAKRFADWAGLGEHTDDALRIRANEYASEELANAADKLDLAYDRLSLEDGAALSAAVRRGSDADIAALSPDARKWYDAFRGKVAGAKGQEEFLKERRVGLTDQRATRANAIAAAMEEWGPDAAKNKEMVEAALAKIESGEWNPTYASLFKPTEEANLLDLLVKDFEANRRYGRLEGRRGGGDYERDIFQVAMRQMDAFHATKAKIRWMDSLLNHLSRKGVLKTVAKIDDLPEGYAVVETPILKKYFEVKNRAGAALVENLQKGLGPGEAIEGAIRKVVDDPETLRTFARANHIAVPKHVARLIDLEFAPPSGLGLLYDTVLGHWKGLAVLWNPRNWVGTAVGNALMDVLHGVGPDSFRRAKQLREIMPPEIRGNIKEFVDQNTGLYQRMTSKLGEYYQKLDEIVTRGPIFAKETEAVRRQLRENLQRTGAAFFIAKEVLDDPQKFAQLVALSPEKLSEASRRLQALQEELSGKLVELRAPTVKAERAARAVAQQEEKIAALRAKLSQIERESGGAVRMQRLASEMDLARESGADLERLLSEAKSGAKRAATAAEEDLIFSFTTGLLNDPGLLGKRGRKVAKQLSERAEEIAQALKAAKKKWADLRRQGQRLAEDGPGKAVRARLAQEVGDLEDLKRVAASLEADLKAQRAEVAQRMADAGQLRAQMPELEQVAAWADEAIDAGNRLAGAYNRLHPVERTVFKRLVPFWTYTKTMTKLVVSLPYLYPKRMFLWNRWSQIVADQFRDPEAPEWLKDYIPVGHTDDGATVIVKVSQFIPWNGVRASEIGGMSVPGLLDFPQAHPLGKLYMELKGATPEYSKRPITPGENMVRMDTGEVYEFTKDGRVRKTIAQPSPLRALWRLWPTSQLIDTLALPYVTTDRGWIGFQEAIQDADGSPMYPVSLLQRLSKVAGVPFDSVDIDELRMREQGTEMRVVRETIQQLRRMPPARREQMSEGLRDWLELNRRRRGDDDE